MTARRQWRWWVGGNKTKNSYIWKTSKSVSISFSAVFHSCTSVDFVSFLISLIVLHSSTIIFRTFVVCCCIFCIHSFASPALSSDATPRWMVAEVVLRCWWNCYYEDYFYPSKSYFLEGVTMNLLKNEDFCFRRATNPG